MCPAAASMLVRDMQGDAGGQKKNLGCSDCTQPCYPNRVHFTASLLALLYLIIPVQPIMSVETQGRTPLYDPLSPIIVNCKSIIVY